MLSTERKIYFYRVYLGRDQGGHPIPFDHVAVFDEVNQLDWDDDGRYWSRRDGRVTCCWVDDLEPLAKIRLGNIRRENLPQVEEEGDLSPLEIPDQSGIVEQIHAVFFENNIVGADYNFYGPRVSSFSYYIKEKIDDDFGILSFEPLLRQDVAEQLEQLSKIRLFQLRVRPSYADVIEEANEHLGKAFRATLEAGSPEEVEIVLKPAPHSRGWLDDKVLATAKKLLGKQGLLDNASKFSVKGLSEKDGKIDTIDLLSDKLIAKKTIMKMDERSRALKKESAYSAIISAHQDLRSHLQEAASVS